MFSLLLWKKTLHIAFSGKQTGKQTYLLTRKIVNKVSSHFCTEAVSTLQLCVSQLLHFVVAARQPVVANFYDRQLMGCTILGFWLYLLTVFVESYLYFLIKIPCAVKSIQSGYAWPVSRHSYIPAPSRWPHNDDTPTRCRPGLLETWRGDR